MRILCYLLLCRRTRDNSLEQFTSPAVPLFSNISFKLAPEILSFVLSYVLLENSGCIRSRIKVLLHILLERDSLARFFNSGFFIKHLPLCTDSHPKVSLGICAEFAEIFAVFIVSDHLEQFTVSS